MTKVSKNTFILLGVAAVFVIVGIFIFTQQKDDPADNQIQTTKEKNCTTYNGTIEEQCAEDYIGLSANEARDKADKNNMQPLTVLIDGKRQGSTDIFRPAPIYFEVNNNTVTKAYFEHDR